MISLGPKNKKMLTDAFDDIPSDSKNSSCRSKLKAKGTNDSLDLNFDHYRHAEPLELYFHLHYSFVDSSICLHEIQRVSC